jgi:hypothetical protein
MGQVPRRRTSLKAVSAGLVGTSAVAGAEEVVNPQREGEQDVGGR